MATKKTEAVAETAVKEEAVEETATPKMVKIKFNRSRKEEGDEWASVNGEKYLIKRGESVEVPAYIAEVYEHREEMLEIAMEYEAQAAQKAEQK